MPTSKKKLKFDQISKFLERVAQISGIRYQKIEKADGEVDIRMDVPMTPEFLPIIMASIPAAIIEEALEPLTAALKKKQTPPNGTFEGKRRF